MKKQKRKGNFQQSIDYIKENRVYIYFIIALFFLSSLFAFIFPQNFEFLAEIIGELKDKTQDLSLTSLTLFIFQNNVTSSFLGLFLGIFLGIFPLFVAAFNGFVIGYVFNLASQIGGYGVAWMLVPHGIFELPAVFISLGLGLSLGWMFVARYFTYYWNTRNFLLLILGVILPFNFLVIFGAFLIDKKLGKGYGTEFNRRFRNSFKVFFIIVVPLLAIAAIIEGLLIAI